MFEEYQCSAALRALKRKQLTRQWGDRVCAVYVSERERAGSCRMSLLPFHYQYCSGVLALSAQSWERCRVTRPHCHTRGGNMGDLRLLPPQESGYTYTHGLELSLKPHASSLRLNLSLTMASTLAQDALCRWWNGNACLVYFTICTCKFMQTTDKQE